MNHKITQALFFMLLFWYNKLGAQRGIRTPGCRDLQSLALVHSAICALAESIGIEPISPFLNESLANSCRTLQHTFHIEIH